MAALTVWRFDIKPALADLDPQLISTNLSSEQEEQLRGAFADE